MILTFTQNPRRVVSDTPVSHEILAMALSSRLAWANVNGRPKVRLRAEIREVTYEVKPGQFVTMPPVLEIHDEC